MFDGTQTTGNQSKIGNKCKRGARLFVPFVMFVMIACPRIGSGAPSVETPADTTGVDTVAAPVMALEEPDSSDERPSPLALRGNGRPNPFTASWRAAQNLATDGIYLYTSPLRMDASNMLGVAAVVGVGAALYAVDDDIYQGFQRSREDPTYKAVVIDAGEFFEPLGLIVKTHRWLEGAAIAGWVLDVPLLRTVPVEILESNLLVGTLRQPIETTVGRRRPSEGEGPRSFTGGRSFPSGHASVVCESAAIMSHHFKHPLARAAFWGIAGVACLQRVDQPGHNHWPSDVWMGAALGTYCGHTIAKRNEERRSGVPQNRWWDVLSRPDRTWSARPVLGPDGGGLTVTTKF